MNSLMQRPDEIRVVRALPADLERVLDGMFRTTERTKEWMRAYFVDGKTINEIAREAGVPHQNVANKVRVVRGKLAEQAAPMQYVQVTLSLPMVLGDELQALANELGERGSLAVATATLDPVLRAVASARKKLASGR